MMDFCVLRIRQKLYLLVPVSLMLHNIMSETYQDRSVELLHLAIDPGNIQCWSNVQCSDTQTVRKNLDKNCGPLSVSKWAVVLYEMTQLSTKVVFAFLEVTLMTDMDLFNFVYGSFKTITC